MITSAIMTILGLFGCGAAMGVGFIVGAHLALRWWLRRSELVSFTAEWRERR